LIKVVPKDKVDEIINKQTIKRFGTLEDIVNVINFDHLRSLNIC